MKNLLGFILVLAGLVAMGVFVFKVLLAPNSDIEQQETVNEGNVSILTQTQRQQSLELLVDECQKGCRRGLIGGLFNRRKINQCKAKCAEDLLKPEIFTFYYN